MTETQSVTRNVFQPLLLGKALRAEGEPETRKPLPNTWHLPVPSKYLAVSQAWGCVASRGRLEEIY